MSKEEKIQECQSKQLLDELSKMPPMVIATAYLHALNYTLYGEDVTEKWVTATQQVCVLEKARNKGYYDALQKQTEYVDYVLDKIRAEIAQEYNRLSATRADETLELGECLGLKMSMKIIDKYKEESEVEE